MLQFSQISNISDIKFEEDTTLLGILPVRKQNPKANYYYTYINIHYIEKTGEFCTFDDNHQKNVLCTKEHIKTLQPFENVQNLMKYVNHGKLYVIEKPIHLDERIAHFVNNLKMGIEDQQYFDNQKHSIREYLKKIDEYCLFHNPISKKESQSETYNLMNLIHDIDYTIYNNILDLMIIKHLGYEISDSTSMYLAKPEKTI